MKKRVLSALLALCMACTLAGNVWAAEETEPTPAPSAGVEAQTVEPQTVEPTPSTEPTQAPAPSPDATAEPEATPEPSAAPSAAPDPTVEPDATPAPTEAPEATAAPAATATPDATAEPTATPAPTEVPAPSETPSATPAPTAEAEGEQVADGVEYTAALEQDGQALNVIVTAPEGAFDAGVTPALSVTAIEDEAEGDAIAAKLDESGVTYDGFAALDISFKNEAGEEIEPKLPVTVRIELPEAIVDSGIDLNTLAVQHLAEDEAGNVTAVEQVASVADGTIALSEEAVAAMEAAAQAAEETDEAAIAPMMLAAPANDALTPDADAAKAPAVAEFEVNGFSTFTITWSSGWTTYFRVTVHYVDENGNEISGPREDGYYNSNDSITNSETITFNAEYGGEIEGYTYQEAHYNSYQGNSIVKMVASSSGYRNPTYYLSFYDREDGSENYGRIDRLSYDTGSWVEETKEAEIYLIYRENETPDPGPDDPDTPINATVTTGKSAVLLDEDTGNYTLNLSVSGDRGNSSQKQKMDVLFILDLSNSMGRDWGSNKRIAHAKNAISQIMGRGDAVGLSDNTNLDVQYALVGFGGGDSNRYTQYVDAGVEQGWTSDPDTLYRGLPEDIVYNPYGNSSNYYGGGTNYEAGFRTGKTLLQSESARKDALKVVIFISDGGPGYYYDNQGQTDGTGTPNNYDRTALQHGVNECKTLDTDYFYFVGVTSDVTSTVFERIVEAVPIATSNKSSISANSPDDLVEAFKDIQQKLTFFEANNVTMTDPLSEYADLVPNEDGTYTVTLQLEKRASANAEYEPAGEAKKVNVAANSNGGAQVELKDETQTVNLTVFIDKDDSGKETIRVEFKDDYKLAQNYRYTVSTTITPSDEAISDGMDVNAAKQTPDAATGTHADQHEVGFWSNDNDNAKVTFDAISTDEDGTITGTDPGKTALFPKPVIQVPEETTTTLTLTKTFDGLSDAEVSYLIFRDDGFGFDVNYCVPEAREDTNTNKLTFMAPDTDVKGLYLPDGTEVASLNNGGGGYLIVAGNYLTKKDISTYNGSYTDPDTGASLIKNTEGNWVYSITLEVPICKNGYFFTVFEQHQEVPGYAKINDSNAEWTITAGESSISGTGKFVDGEQGKPNVYESMTELGIDKTYRKQEDFAIAQGALRKLTITEPTTIAFTNHYTGKLDVTKEIGKDNQNRDAETATYTFTIAPAHPNKLTVTGGLNGKTVHYTVDEGAEQTATLGNDGSFTVTLQKDQVLHFLDLPAIQWQVTESDDPVSSEHYQLHTSYTDENNNVVGTVTHWNGYNEGETIGVTSEQDGIASVDSAVCDNENPAVTASAVAEVTVTNEYIRNTYELTVNKSVTGPMGDKTEEFTFTLKLTDTANNNSAYEFAEGEVPNGLTATQTSGEYTFELSDSESLTVKLPSGVQAVVTEDSDDAAGYEVKTRQYKSGGTEGNFTVNTTRSVEVDSTTEDYTVDFQNFRDVVTPTGLESNHTKPYALMVGAGALAGLALVGGILARRARRRREW